MSYEALLDISVFLIFCELVEPFFVLPNLLYSCEVLWGHVRSSVSACFCLVYWGINERCLMGLVWSWVFLFGFIWSCHVVGGLVRSCEPEWSEARCMQMIGSLGRLHLLLGKLLKWLNDNYSVTRYPTPRMHFKEKRLDWGKIWRRKAEKTT